MTVVLEFGALLPFHNSLEAWSIKRTITVVPPLIEFSRYNVQFHSSSPPK